MIHEHFILQAYQRCMGDILSAAFNTVGEAIIVANEEGDVVMLNKHVLEIWGYAADDLLGDSLVRLMPEQYREMHTRGMQRYIETGEYNVLNKRVELEALHASGEIFPIQLYISESRIEGHRFFTAAIRDISEIVDARNKLEQTRKELLQANNLIKARNEELTKEVRLDSLTRVLNHVALKEQIGKEIDRMSRSHKPLSILFIDIDDFKQLNDDFGHLHGDDCLRDLTSLINDNIIRKVDTFGRYGGEEFLLIMPEADVRSSIIAGDRLRKAVESHSWQHQQLTVTVGVATADEAIPVNTLINRADLAMYFGKQNGKNQLNHWENLQYK